eukprot:1913186-Rhodomonas_salina.3
MAQLGAYQTRVASKCMASVGSGDSQNARMSVLERVSGVSSTRTRVKIRAAVECEITLLLCLCCLNCVVSNIID